MRAGALVAAALLAAGCAGLASGGDGEKSSTTRLEIKLWPRGRGGPVRAWTLRCPGGGTLPRARSACSTLARLRHPFAPVSRQVACTQVYGGPQLAQVRGTFEGRPVAAVFNRTNGCEIDRWNRLSFLFPARR